MLWLWPANHCWSTEIPHSFTRIVRRTENAEVDSSPGSWLFNNPNEMDHIRKPSSSTTEDGWTPLLYCKLLRSTFSAITTSEPLRMLSMMLTQISLKFSFGFGSMVASIFMARVSFCLDSLDLSNSSHNNVWFGGCGWRCKLECRPCDSSTHGVPFLR